MRSKIFIPFLLLVFTINACKNDELKDEKVIIAGKVLNYENHSDYFKIEFHFEDLLFIDEKYEAIIDNNGNFRIEVPCAYPQDFMVWNTKWITLFC